MALLNSPLLVPAQLSSFFSTLQGGQAPPKFSREFLKDIGFTSKNHHAFIPLLKGLGFLSPDGIPTQRYRDFLDSTKWKTILAEAIKEAYSDIFVIKSKPTKSDLKTISGKFKTAFNTSEIVAERSARTFLALIDMADEGALYADSGPSVPRPPSPEQTPEPSSPASSSALTTSLPHAKLGLHYNIQIHLPATKDIEVYNAIFKSLRGHLID